LANDDPPEAENKPGNKEGFFMELSMDGLFVYVDACGGGCDAGAKQWFLKRAGTKLLPINSFNRYSQGFR
jgi:hypothetical protein